MYLKILFFVLLVWFYAFANLQSTAREHFEWGEYSALIEILAPCIDSLSESSDSSIIAQCHSYLGVAYFSTESISNARTHFLKALHFDSTLSLPPDYVTLEIKALFNVIKSEFAHQKRLNHIEDSLRIAKNLERENLYRKMQIDELYRKRKRSTIPAISCSITGAVFLGLAIFQSNTTVETHREFKHAADLGDKLRYDQLREEIRRSNKLILTCDIISGVALVTGFISAIKVRTFKKQLAKMQ